MNFKNKILMKAAFLASLALSSTTALAVNVDTGVLESCEYRKTVLNTPPFSAKFGTENTTICIDVPVALDRAKAVFNLETDAVKG
jgi:hypothetical protein